MHKTILVTGGAGYIGSHISFYLAQQGYKIIILDQLLHKQIFNYPWATLIQKDFGNKKNLNTIFSEHNISAVIHCAALANIKQSVEDPHYCYQNNTMKTLSLLESMIAHNIKNFIFSSSCAIYGVPTQIPISENHHKNPINPYGKSKLMVEYMLEDFQNAYGLNFVALRFFNAAGAFPEYNLGEYHKPETHIIPLLLDALYKNKPFSIFGTDYPTPDGTCIRDFLHVWDIASAHAQALEHLNNKQPSDFFNLGTGQGISVLELIRATEHILRKQVKLVFAKPRLGDPPILVANPVKSTSILRWKPHYSSLEYIIKSAHHYHLKAHLTQKTLCQLQR